MSIGSVIRKVAGAPLAVGKAVGGELKEALQAPVDSSPTPSFPAYTPPEYKPMDLPELDKNGLDYEEKNAIHDYVRKLEAAHEEHRKSQGDEYHKQFEELAKYVDSKPTARRFSPLSMFAIAMGNPEAMKNVAAQNSKADDEVAKRDEYLLTLKENALKGNIQRLMEEGNFKKALTESAALQELNHVLKLASEKRQQRDELEKIREQNKGKLGVAEINRDKAISVAMRRAEAAGQAFGLKKELLKAQNATFRTYLSGLMGRKNMMGENVFDEQTVSDLINAHELELERLAEDPNNLETPTGATPAPRAASGVSPAPNIQPAAPGQGQISPRAARVLANRQR